jgi:hypothetical protein
MIMWTRYSRGPFPPEPGPASSSAGPGEGDTIGGLDMRIPRRAQNAIDTRVVQPVKNAVALAITAICIAVVALIAALASL